MGSLTNFAELELLDHIFGNGAYTPASTIYLGLLTADATETGSVAGEPSGNGYARVAISFGAAASRAITQGAQVTFPQCTDTWGTLTHWGIFDALTSGNMLAYGALNSSIPTAAGNVPFVAAGSSIISVNAGAASDYLANTLLNFIFRNTAFSVPSLYVAMCDANPTDSGTGTTISEPGGNYARVSVTAWSNAASGALSNEAAIVFPTPSANWPTITYSAICDAATLGNLLLYATATPNQAPLIGDPVQFPIGDYDVTLT